MGYPRFKVYVWRRLDWWAPGEPGDCRYCPKHLETCPACQGAWRERRCTACGAGLLCPEHGRYWLA